jgi:hypothetical protein
MIKMRTTYKRYEIKEILKQALGSDKSVTIWQFEHDQRRIFTGEFIEINDDTTTLDLGDLSKYSYELRSDEPLYIHGNYKKFVFKRDHFGLDGKVLTVKTPSELKVEDLRSKDRFSFKYQDHKVFSYSFNGKDEKMSQSAFLVDLSIKGAGIIMPTEEASNLQYTSSVTVNAITDQKLPEGLKAQIKHLTLYETGEENTEDLSLTRVGLQFDQIIDSISYKSVLSIVEKKQKRVIGLDVETFHGLDELQLDKALAALDANDGFTAGKIRENIECIDRLRYLTPHMKTELFLEVNHAIFAVALRLSSKELIFELLSEVTDTIREELLFQMKDSHPISAVKKSQETIIEYIKEKEKKGEFVLDPDTFVEYV